MPNDGHVACSEAFAQAGLILLESAIEDPMQAVLDAPVPAHGLGGACGIEGSGGNVVACLAVRLAGAFDLGLDPGQTGTFGSRSSPGKRR